MKSLILPALAMLALAVPAQAAPEGLARFVWKNRVLLIVSSAATPARDRQRTIVEAERAGLAERDMVVIDVSADTATILFGEAGTLDPAALRAEVGVDAETPFAAILIGKDGGIKLSETAPVAAVDLFRLIDSMPMRASETRK